MVELFDFYKVNNKTKNNRMGKVTLNKRQTPCNKFQFKKLNIFITYVGLYYKLFFDSIYLRFNFVC